MKRKISYVLSLLLLFAVLGSACSSGGTSNNSTGTKTDAPSSATTTNKNVTLKMWTWKVAYTPGFQAAAKLFEKKTGAKIEIETFTPDDTYKQKYLAAANSKTLPDIVHYWAANTQGVENSLVQLSDIIKKETLAKFYGPAMDPILVTQDLVDKWKNDPNASNVTKSLKAGEFYGLPLDIGGFFTFYGNKKIITDAGLKPAAPKTWEEFVSMMETIKQKKGVPGLVFGAKSAGLFHNWADSALNIMYNGPEAYIDLLERKSKMNDPKHVKVINALGTLAQKDLLMSGLLSTDIDGADQAFAAGKAAFDLGGSFTMSTLLAMGMKAEDMVTFPVPPIEGSKITQWATDPFTLTMMSVNKDSKNKDLALQFIEFMTTDPEAAIAFANGAYTIPALNLSGRSGDFTPNLKAIVESFSTQPGPYAKAAPAIRANRSVHKEWDVYYKSQQAMMEKKMTPEQVAKSFDDAMEDLKASGK